MTTGLNCKLNISNKTHFQPQGLPSSRLPSTPAPWLAARPGALSRPQGQVNRRGSRGARPAPNTQRALIGRLQRRGGAGPGGLRGDRGQRGPRRAGGSRGRCAAPRVSVSGRADGSVGRRSQQVSSSGRAFDPALAARSAVRVSWLPSPHVLCRPRR